VASLIDTPPASAASEVRRGAERERLALPLAPDLVDDHEPRVDAEADLHRARTRALAEATLDVDRAADRALRVVFVRLRIAEISQDAVAEILRDVTFVGPDRLRAHALVVVQHLAQVFGIDALGELRRAHQVAEHHAQLPALTAHVAVTDVGFGARACVGFLLRRTALIAEARVRRVLVPAGGTAHGPPPPRSARTRVATRVLDRPRRWNCLPA
jgi:hypothetical protein